MTSNNPFGTDALQPGQVDRLRQAAGMIADGDAELEQKILNGTATNLQKLLKNRDTSAPEEVESAVDEAEMLMTDLAFGSDEELFRELPPETDDISSILEDDINDEFMGGGNFESLDALEEAETEDSMSYEDFQEEWN